MYQVEVIHEKDYTFTVKSKNYQFTVDVKGDGVTPPDTLLASLGSCIGVYVRKYADGAKLAIENFNITVTAEFSKEPPVCFREIKVHLDLKGAQLDERRRKALLEFIKNCPVHHTLEANPAIEIEVI
ncbi:MAG: OsmC family protein [Candidatus Omnitrophica bacterium]|nr:OsmC family protein [Candidatus Omnitrophota bacterium]